MKNDTNDHIANQIPAQAHEKITLAISGASGVQYGLRLLECLLQSGRIVYLLLSQAAYDVIDLETDLQLPENRDIASVHAFFCDMFNVDTSQLIYLHEKEWTAPIASGSGITDAMVICPCSSGMLSAIRHGASNNLVERAADVALKEKKQLICVARETPLSIIHCENMLALSQCGATILPASPGFYHKPQHINELIDFIVARVLDHLHITHDLIPRWG